MTSTVSKTPSAALPRFYRNLEVFRFLAAFAVVVYHYYMFATPVPVASAATWNVNDAPLSNVFGILFQYGSFGVQFFWLLSGFIFFSQYADRIRSRKVSGTQFFSLRFSRLYPLHIVTALIVFFAQNFYSQVLNHGKGTFFGAGASIRDLVLHAMMASGWSVGQGSAPSLNVPFWSVSLEVLAYVSFFLLMRFLPRTALALAAVSLLVLPWVAQDFNVFNQVFVYFYAGGALYLLVKLAHWVNVTRVRLVAAGALGAASIAFGLAVFTHQGALLLPQVNMLLTIMFCLWILAAALAPQLDGKSGKVAEFLGNMTYASYLIHFPILLLTVIGFQLAKTPVPWQQPGMLIAWIVIVFGLSPLVYQKFETPVQQYLRSRFGVAGTRSTVSR